MAAASNYLENKVLDHVLLGTPFAQPSSLYVGLFNNVSSNAATNLEAGNLSDEVAVGAYARSEVAFGPASGGVAANSAQITFPVATAAWGTITHVAILDAAVNGNVLFWGPAAVQKTIDTGDTFIIYTGNLTIALT